MAGRKVPSCCFILLLRCSSLSKMLDTVTACRLVNWLCDLSVFICYLQVMLIHWLTVIHKLSESLKLHVAFPLADV
jgi:hypothetical protein